MFPESQSLTGREGVILPLHVLLMHFKRCRSRSSPRVMTLRRLATYTPVSWWWLHLWLVPSASSSTSTFSLSIFPVKAKWLTNTHFVDRNMLPFKLLPSSKVDFFTFFWSNLGMFLPAKWPQGWPAGYTLFYDPLHALNTDRFSSCLLDVFLHVGSHRYCLWWFWFALHLLLDSLLHGVHFQRGLLPPSETLQGVRERMETMGSAYLGHRVSWALACRVPGGNSSSRNSCHVPGPHFLSVVRNCLRGGYSSKFCVYFAPQSLPLGIFPLSAHLLWNVKATTYIHIRSPPNWVKQTSDFMALVCLGSAKISGSWPAFNRHHALCYRAGCNLLFHGLLWALCVWQHQQHFLTPQSSCLKFRGSPYQVEVEWLLCPSPPSLFTGSVLQFSYSLSEKYRLGIQMVRIELFIDTGMHMG